MYESKEEEVGASQEDGQLSSPVGRRGGVGGRGQLGAKSQAGGWGG